MNKKTQQIEEFWASSTDSNDLISKAQQFLCSLDKSYRTVTAYYHNVRYFITWCHKQNTYFPEQITTQLLDNYRDYVATVTSNRDPQKLLNKDGRLRRILHVKHFIKWLAQNQDIAANINFSPQLPEHQQFWEQTTQKNDLLDLAKKYIAVEKATSKSEKSKRSTKHYVRYFVKWCHEQQITIPKQITQSIISLYQIHISQIKSSKSDKLVSASEQTNRLKGLKKYLNWLQKHKRLNKKIEIEYPQQAKKLPKQVLSHSQIKVILKQPDTTTLIGIRDRAILETLYSTGVRRSELINLDVSDINFDRAILHVRQGKGNKDRYIPIGKKALKWVQVYLTESRDTFLSLPQQKALFLNKSGVRLRSNRLNELVTKHIRNSGISNSGSCHMFRHSMAVGLLNNGCEIRYIQEMLGHAQLETTEIYTKVSINKLKEIHKQTHPAKMHSEKNLDILQELENEFPL